MPEPEKNDKDKKGEGDKNEKELTTLELTEMVKKQNDIIETMRAENTTLATNMENIIVEVEKKFGENSVQMQNVTNLLGKWAAGEFEEGDTGGEGDKGRIDFGDMTQDKFKNIVTTMINTDKKVTEDKKKELNKLQADDYRKVIIRSLGTRLSPEGKPLDKKTRDDIMTLLKTKIRDISSDDGTEAGLINFEKAYNMIFGLGKVSPFKGSDDVDGLGVGAPGGGEKKTTETIKLTKATENFLANTKNLGIDAKEAGRLLERRNKRLKDLV